MQKPPENGRKGWDFMRNGVLVVSLVCFVCHDVRPSSPSAEDEAFG